MAEAKEDMQNGRNAYSAREYALAARHFRSARDAFTAAAQTLESAEAANNLSVALLMAGDPQGALDAASGTQIVFQSAGMKEKEGIAWANLAAAATQLGRKPEALALYEQANQCLRESGSSELRGTVLRKISLLQLQTGHQYQAVASLNAAWETEHTRSPLKRCLRRLFSLPMRLLTRR